MRNRFPVTLWLTLVALVAALALPARANTALPPGSRLVGQNQFHVVQDDGGSLEAIAKKYNVGFPPCCRPIPGLTPMFRAPAAC